MKLSAGLEPQPLYPIEDLTEANADALELLMLNKLVVQNGHQAAESAAWAFKVGHPTAIHVGEMLHDGSYIDAVHHGVSVFEAMHTAVMGEAVQGANKFDVNAEAHTTLMAAREGYMGHTLESLDLFRDEMPRSAEIISKSSNRFFGPRLADYALVGAAIERRIAIDSLPDLGKVG